MKKEEVKNLISQIYEEGEGIFRLAPAWVPRVFSLPGKRLKLSTGDLYILGSNRGGIDERWLASVTVADNGPGTPPDEGLSYIVFNNKRMITLREAIQVGGDFILGEKIMQKYGGWKILTKFFDNMGPLPFHLHQDDKQAKLVNREGKPEAYYFPPELNFIENNFPHTYFGLEPGTKKEDIKKCLKNWHRGDNSILSYSRAYRIKPGTGWFIPPRILHAPGSLVTYEVQWASDVASMFQPITAEGINIPWDLLVKDIPQEKHQDIDYIVSLIDWPKNTDEYFKSHHYLEPITASGEKGVYKENWIIYGTNDLFSAKELTVFPGKEIRIKENGAYGLVVIQGYGNIERFPVESPTTIRYGDLTYDELFVCFEAARKGILIKNRGKENLVILKCFGPATNPDMPPIETHSKRE